MNFLVEWKYKPSAAPSSSQGSGGGLVTARTRDDAEEFVNGMLAGRCGGEESVRQLYEITVTRLETPAEA